MSDAGLFLFLRAKLRSGDLVVVRFATKGARQDEGAARQRRLVRQIEAKSGRRLSYQGRTYRLTVDVELSRLLDRDSYQVMSHREAVAVLLALAKEGNGGPELGGLLSQAADLLTRDWRPPHEPNGLVLLRRYPVQQASLPDDGPAVTPSQLKKLTQTDWIEIELVDEEGQPYSTHYRLELTDNALREGELGTDGFLGAYEIASGQCKLTLRAAELPPTDTAEEADQEAGATEVIEPPADLEDELPPASLPSATVEAEQHWIEILLVNEQQAPLPNVEVCLTVDGQSRKAVADGNGRVRINDLPGDSAKLELSDPESLRIQLRDSAIAAAP